MIKIIRTPTLIQKYIIKEYILFQLSALFFLYLVLLINQLLVHAKELLSNNIPFHLILQLLLFASPSVLLWALPFSAIVGALMAVSRMTADNEILAIRISGYSLREIVRPLMIYATILLIFSLLLSNIIMPVANENYRVVGQKIAKAQARTIFNDETVKAFDGRVISIGKREKDQVKNLIIIDTDDEGRQRVITAPSATVIDNAKNPAQFSIRMNNVHSIAAVNDNRLLNYQRFKASLLYYNILFSQELNIGSTIDEDNIFELLIKLIKEYNNFRQSTNFARARADIYRDYYQKLEEKPNRLESTYTRYRDNLYNKEPSFLFQSLFMKLYEKITLALLCVIFTFLAFIVAILTGKNGIGLGLVLGILIAVFYWVSVYIVRFTVIEYNKTLLLIFVPDLLVIALTTILALRIYR